MKERPILFNSAMVCAILDGRKTQTRRIAKPQPDLLTSDGRPAWSTERGAMCQHGHTGDRLWVRETFADEGARMCREDCYYRADGECDLQGGRWTPSIHMPRWASRITLEITGLRVERLKDITEQDALAEGVDQSSLWVPGPRGTLIPPEKKTLTGSHPTARHAFSCLWESINGSGSWEQNPWVWVIEFKIVWLVF